MDSHELRSNPSLEASEPFTPLDDHGGGLLVREDVRPCTADEDVVGNADIERFWWLIHLMNTTAPSCEGIAASLGGAFRLAHWNLHTHPI
jgi:hypothetical protein